MKKLKTLKQKLQEFKGKGNISQKKGAIISQLKLMGFEAIKTRNPNHRIIYINYKTKIVVKFPNIYSGDKTLDEIPEYACPTEVIRLGHATGCFIQPIVNDNGKDIRSHSMFRRFQEKLYRCKSLTDTHVGNMGIYRNKLIIHDW